MAIVLLLNLIFPVLSVKNASDCCPVFTVLLLSKFIVPLLEEYTLNAPFFAPIVAFETLNVPLLANNPIDDESSILIVDVPVEVNVPLF